MARSLLLAFARPRAGADVAEFERWYDETHLPQVLGRIPAILSARRYRMADTQFAGVQSEFSHVTLFEMQAADVATVRDALGNLYRQRQLDLSPTADVKASISYFLDEIAVHVGGERAA